MHSRYSDRLTPAETDVLRLMAHGYTNPQIAKLRRCTVRAVATHGYMIFDKLSVSNRVQAARYAWRTGLVTIDEAWQTVEVMRRQRA